MSNIMQTSLSYAYDYMLRMDDRRVGQPGAVALPPWSLKMMTSDAFSVQNALNVLLALSALGSSL